MRVRAGAVLGGLLLAACTGSASAEMQREELVASGPVGEFVLSVEVPESIEPGADRLLFRYAVENRSAEGWSAAVDIGVDGAPDGCDVEIFPWSEVGVDAGYPQYNIEVGEIANSSLTSDVPAECVGRFEIVFRLTVIERDAADPTPGSERILRLPVTITS